MSLTFIDTNKLPKKTTVPGQGEVTEVLNQVLVRRQECARLAALAESGRDLQSRCRQQASADLRHGRQRPHQAE